MTWVRISHLYFLLTSGKSCKESLLETRELLKDYTIEYAVEILLFNECESGNINNTFVG